MGTEKRFRFAVEAARCGVWEWDLAKGEVSLSDYLAALLGFSRGGVTDAEDVIGRVHPRFQEDFRHALRQAAAYGAFEITFPVAGPDGRARWIDARGQARGERGMAIQAYDRCRAVLADLLDRSQKVAQPIVKC